MMIRVQIPKGDMRVIKRDVRGITNSWREFKAREKVPELPSSEKRRDPQLVRLRKEQLRLHDEFEREKAQEERDERSARTTARVALQEHKQYEELLVGAAHAKAKLATQRSALAAKELHVHENAAAKLAALKSAEVRLALHKQRLAKMKAAAATAATAASAAGGDAGNAAGASKRGADDAEALDDEASVLGISQQSLRGTWHRRADVARSVDRAWARAAQAAAAGDRVAVRDFCAVQESPGACREALYGRSAARGRGEARAARGRAGAGHARREPCDPGSIGYLQCLGVHGTGATLGGA
jgi:hypothetical protein